MRPDRRPARRASRPRIAALLLAYLALLGWSGTTVLGSTSGPTVSVMCSTIEDLCRAWADDFTARTGIAVSTVRLSTGEALTRLSRPGGAGDFDVWHGGTSFAFETAHERGLLAPYDSPEAAAVPAELRDPGGAWTGVYLGVMGFCSNTAVLERLGAEVPTSWDDLLDPALARQVSAPNPSTSGSGYSLVWATWLREGSRDATIDYLTALDDQVLQYTNSGLSPARVAGRGEAAVALTFSQHCVKAHDEGYGELVVSYPDDGTSYEVGGVALLAGAPHGDEARWYVDFAVSRRAQALGASTHSSQLPTRPDVRADPRLGGDALLLPGTPAQAAAARPALMAAVEEALR